MVRVGRITYTLVLFSLELLTLRRLRRVRVTVAIRVSLSLVFLVLGLIADFWSKCRAIVL